MTVDREQVRRDPERDYIARTIATIRNHRDADNCWPQWANALADEIERLDVLHMRADAMTETKRELLADALRRYTTWGDAWIEARALLLDIEGSIIAYWTDIPESELERIRLRIREVADGHPVPQDRGD